MHLIPPVRLRYFRQKLLLWHERDNKRQMPWKGEKDVYKIWLSEIILQQTRVEQGKDYYLKFITQFPAIQQLAKAPLERVYKLWEGLGYYNRCKNLHHTAQTVAREMGGKFPGTYEGLLGLKGVGPYTAAAIASFAYNLPHAVVDGNVYRLLSRFFGIAEPTDSKQGQALFHALAQDCLHPQKAALYNQAIMDLGATVCKPDLPQCNVCPLRRKCVAYEQDLVSELPYRTKHIQKRDRWFVFFSLHHNNQMAVRKREDKDIWYHLHELPHYEAGSQKDWEQFINKEYKSWISSHYGTIHSGLSVSAAYRQPLTHQHIHAVFIQLNLKQPLPHLRKNWQWVNPAARSRLAFPKIINQFLISKEMMNKPADG